MADELTPTEMGRALAAMRQTVTGGCVVCGKEFTGTAKRRHCSNTCAAKAYRDRHKAELAERRRRKYLSQKAATE